MATTIVAAPLTVTVTENISLSGKKLGGVNTKIISGIKSIDKRTMTVTTTEAVIGIFSSSIANGKYIAANVRYIRFTNKDDTNFITLTFKDEDNTEFRVKLDAGQSFMYTSDNDGGLVDTMKANGAALSSGLADLYDITADADTASCDLEMLIASV